MAGMLKLTPPSISSQNNRLQDKGSAGRIRTPAFQPSAGFKRQSITHGDKRVFAPRLSWLQGIQKLPSHKLFSNANKKSNQLLKESRPGSCVQELQEYFACGRRRHHCRQSIWGKRFMGLSSQRQSLHQKSNFLSWRMPVPLPYFYGLSTCSNAVPSASTGPDEPHVASTMSLPEEGFLEKQGLGIWEHEIKGTDIEGFLSSKLPSHPKLYRGQLKNGLRYVILPNKVPPNRFEAHMEIHVGSVDEGEEEQGIAHMIEHVAFLGSKKREKLLGTGARSNAYTDFHHTVFHVHSPFMTKESDGSLLPFVLDALHEIAFKPKFLSSRVEKERRAVLSELQMMNTIEYRVDCQLLQQLHSENKLGSRFPIGLEEQIKKWDVEAIKSFHERWYFPANATLYVVGDIDSVPKTVYQIDAVFGRTLPGNELTTVHPSNAFDTMAHFLAPKLPSVLSGAVIGDGKPPLVQQSKQLRKERHAVRPPVKHEWSLPGVARQFKKPHIFQHELIQNFSIHMFCKIPVNKVETYGDLRNVLMKRIFLSTLHFRINTRYKSSNPPFTAIELDHSDSGREGCTVSTLTVTAEPRNWRDAVKVAVQEVRRLKEFGVTKGELTRYMNALIKDSEQLAAMIDNVPSIDNLDFIMESYALGHTVMDQEQGHESLVAVAETVSLEDVNAAGAKLLEYISDFGNPTAPLPAAIVACVPMTVHEDGVGDVEFKILPKEITDAMNEGLNASIEPEPELEVPKELLSALQLKNLWLSRKPAFVSVHDDGTELKLVDKETSIVQRRLSNGIRVNYKISQNEAKGGVMRLVVSGGRAKENVDAWGAVVVGVRTLSEGGRVGGFSREQVELFCVNHLINCSLESTEEFICMEFRFTLRDGGMRAAFQLLHMVLEHNVWLEDAFHRATQLYLSYYRAMPKSLERATAYRLMLAMLKGDERFLEPSPQTIQHLTLPVVKDAVMKQFVTDNMEVSIVGDFTEEDIEACVLDYLGTITAHKSGYDESEEKPITFQALPTNLRRQQVFLKDTDERACAYIAGPTPNRWGFTVDGQDLNNCIEPIPDSLTEEQAWSLAPHNMKVIKDANGKFMWKNQNHPLYCCVTLTLLAEIINSRLFTTVRDSLGLTYDVSIELSLFDRLKLGWFVISVTSTPAKVYKAVDACINVLRGLHSSKITQRELDRARRTLLMRHESDIKSNAYWLGLLTHLQAPSVPRKDIACIRDLPSIYEATTIDDVYNAYSYLKVDDDSIFTCIGISGSQAGGDTNVIEMDEDDPELFDSHQGFIPVGRGSTTMTRPTI